MVGNFLPSSSEYIRILPEIILCVFGVLLMVLEAITSERQKAILGRISLVGIALAFLANLYAYTTAGPSVPEFDHG